MITNHDLSGIFYVIFCFWIERMSRRMRQYFQLTMCRFVVKHYETLFIQYVTQVQDTHHFFLIYIVYVDISYVSIYINQLFCHIFCYFRIYAGKNKRQTWAYCRYIFVYLYINLYIMTVFLLIQAKLCSFWISTVKKKKKKIKQHDESMAHIFLFLSNNLHAIVDFKFKLIVRCVVIINIT